MKNYKKKSLLEKTEFFLLQYEDGDHTKDFVKKHLEELGKVIQFHNYRYHSLADPLITDGEYDKLVILAQSWEKKYPELFKHGSLLSDVGGNIVNGFQKKAHKVPMLSLQNTYNALDIRNWAEFLQRQLLKKTNNTVEENNSLSYFIEAKLDGSSVEFIYKYGRLTGGITRGDGSEGEDISQHIKYIANLPHYIKDREKIAEIHLRGEVVMPETAFMKVNDYQEKTGGTIFSNSRNAAAGTLRQLDPLLVQKRGLICYCFDLLFCSEDFPEYTTADRLFDYLASVGIPIFSRNAVVSTINDLVAICEDDEIRKETQGGNITCDGLVIKINDLSKRKLIGSTQHHPRWAIAYKYPAEEIAAHLIDISYQVGRTGVITPLAHVEPVSVSGVTIAKATLHNFDFIRNRDIRKNDRVWLKRSGEVIPYVIGPIIERRTGSEEVFVIPSTCPMCGGSIENDGEQVAYICTNSDCIGKRIALLKHFVSRKCMNISGLGDAVIEMLVNSGLVLTISDIFKLSRQDKKHHLSILPGIGAKKISQILQEIEHAKKKPLRRLIHGLGLLGVGIKVAKTIAQYLYTAIIDHQNLNNSDISYNFLLETLSKDNLLTLYGIGEHTAEAVEQYVKDNKSLITELLDQGLFSPGPDRLDNIGSDKKSINDDTLPNSSVLEGETIVITGSFKYTRDQITEALEYFGASVTGSISNATTKLLKGDNAGSKMKKAKKMNIETISLKKLFDIYPSIQDFLEINDSVSLSKNKSIQSAPKQSGLFEV